MKLFVPGRLCLFGEHTDWSASYQTKNPTIKDGLAIVAATNLGIHCDTQKSNKLIVKSKNSSFICNMNYLNLNKIALSENFYRFVASAALHMLTKYMVGGIKINIQNMDLPIQVGLSSSACISVLVVRSFNKIYNLGLSKKQEMEAAYKSEFYTGSRCGKLDQLVALNKSALLAKFNKKSITIKDIKIRNDLDIIVVKFNGNKKNTIKILKDLSSAFPFPKNHQSKLAFNALGKDNQLIVNKAMDYLATGNNKQIGRLMNKAQSIFDKKLAPLSPQQLTAPTFHRFINDKIIKKNIHGAKWVGSGGDVCIQLVPTTKKSLNIIIGHTINLGFTPYHMVIKRNCK